jgi:hypothetical protein
MYGKELSFAASAARKATMLKRILVSGLLGAIVMILWAFVANAIFGLRSSVDMNQVPNENHVYTVLKERIVEPGGYMCNPPLTSAGVFPPDEPVFSIHYSGVGHESAGRLMVLGLVIAFVASMIAAWMLSLTGGRVISRYSRRVLFFAVIGLLFAVFSDLARFDIGGYPLISALLQGASDLISWTLAGLVMAWWIRPEPSDVTQA